MELHIQGNDLSWGFDYNTQQMWFEYEGIHIVVYVRYLETVYIEGNSWKTIIMEAFKKAKEILIYAIKNDNRENH